MKKRELNEKTLIPIGLAVSVIGGAAFWLSAMFHQVQTTSASVAKIESKLEVLAGMRTDIEVIKIKMQQIEKPILRTHASVVRIKRELLLAGPVAKPQSVCSRLIEGPFSMIESGK